MVDAGSAQLQSTENNLAAPKEAKVVQDGAPPMKKAAITKPAVQRSALARKATVRMINVDDIDEDPENARRVFDEAKLKALGTSLKELQQDDIHIRSPAGKRVVLVDGARRLRAAKLVGIKQLQAKDWGDVDAATAARLAARSVLQKEGLTPLEEARLYKRLLDSGMQKKQICEDYSIPFNTLQGRLELLDLPEKVAERVGDARGAVSGTVFGMGHAKALAPFVKHPKLLEAGLKALVDAKELPEAGQAARFVVERLNQQKLILRPEDLLGYSYEYNHKPTQAAVDKLDGLDLPYYGSSKQRFVLDVDGLAKVASEHNAAVKAKRAKENAAATKDQKAAKGDPEAAKRAKARADLDEKVRELRRRLVAVAQGTALAQHVIKNDKLRTQLIWRQLCLDLDIFDNEAEGLVAIAKGLKLDEAAVRATFVEKRRAGDDETYLKHPKPDQVPDWFAKAKLETQAILSASVASFDNLTREGAKAKLFFGASPDEIGKRVEAEIREKVKTEAKAKPTANSKSAKPDGFHSKETSAAIAKAAAKEKPASKAASKPKAKGKPAKKPTKDPPGVVTARAKLAKVTKG